MSPCTYSGTCVLDWWSGLWWLADSLSCRGDRGQATCMSRQRRHLRTRSWRLFYRSVSKLLLTLKVEILALYQVFCCHHLDSDRLPIWSPVKGFQPLHIELKCLEIDLVKIEDKDQVGWASARNLRIGLRVRLVEHARQEFWHREASCDHCVTLPALFNGSTRLQAQVIYHFLFIL